MIKRIMNVDINYVNYGNKDGDMLVFLHGWGQNIQMMDMIGQRFKDKFNILILDLPGFGGSAEPDFVWSCYDYAKCVNELVSDLNGRNVTIIGHSFGGKIGLIYASKYSVKKLVCFASPFCHEKDKNSFSVRMLKKAASIRLLKGVANFAKSHMGSTDYRNASMLMRNILVGHVNLDIYDDIKSIKCPTLLLWGTCDQAVSYNRALELEKLISDCGLVTYEGCTHYAYLERLEQTVSVLKSFLM